MLEGCSHRGTAGYWVPEGNALSPALLAQGCGWGSLAAHRLFLRSRSVGEQVVKE